MFWDTFFGFFFLSTIFQTCLTVERCYSSILSKRENKWPLVKIFSPCMRWVFSQKKLPSAPIVHKNQAIQTIFHPRWTEKLKETLISIWCFSSSTGLFRSLFLRTKNFSNEENSSYTHESNRNSWIPLITLPDVSGTLCLIIVSMIICRHLPGRLWMKKSSLLNAESIFFSEKIELLTSIV